MHELASLPAMRLSAAARILPVAALLPSVCLLLLLAWPLPARADAYVPHTGDRAAPLSGRDLATEHELRLEDLRGKWVLLDFWSATCGPCKRDLPVLCAAAQPYLDRGELELVLVSLDTPASTARMQEFLATLPPVPHMLYPGQHALPYGPPELVARGLDYCAPQAVEWNIHGIPATYLITPEGVIAAKRLRADNVADMLAYFTGRAEPHAPVALRTGASFDEEAQITVRIEAASASHAPLQARLTYRLKRLEYKEYEGCLIQDRATLQFAEPVTRELCLMFDGFGDAVAPIDIDARGYQGLEYKVEVLLPGSESMADGAGLWLRQSGDVDFTLPWLCSESAN